MNLDSVVVVVLVDCSMFHPYGSSPKFVDLCVQSEYVNGGFCYEGDLVRKLQLALPRFDDAWSEPRARKHQTPDLNAICYRQDIPCICFVVVVHKKMPISWFPLGAEEEELRANCTPISLERIKKYS